MPALISYICQALLIIYTSTMAASADKVQYILESLLEESISLVKRGIFSQVDLREMMSRREKC